MPAWTSDLAQNPIYLEQLVGKLYMKLFNYKVADYEDIPKKAPWDWVLVNMLANHSILGQDCFAWIIEVNQHNFGIVLGMPDTEWMLKMLKIVKPDFMDSLQNEQMFSVK